MALKEYSRDDLRKIEEDLQDVAVELRKLRQEWENSGPDTLLLEIGKAEGFVAYLKETWIGRLYGQYKTSKAKAAATTRQKKQAEKKK